MPAVNKYIEQYCSLPYIPMFCNRGLTCLGFIIWDALTGKAGCDVNIPNAAVAWSFVFYKVNLHFVDTKLK